MSGTRNDQGSTVAQGGVEGAAVEPSPNGGQQQRRSGGANGTGRSVETSRSRTGDEHGTDRHGAAAGRRVAHDRN